MLNACYILHRRAYRETSLLLDVFSYQHGKISILAKGAYKARSAQSAQLQPFQPLLIDWVGRSSLKTLSKAEAPRPALQFSGMNLYAAMYINELLYKLLQEEQPAHQLFEAYVGALDALSSSSSIDNALRVFEAKLLRALGLLPDLVVDWQGHPLEPSSTYYLSQEGSLVSTAPNSPISPSNTLGKQLIISGTDAQWLAIVSDSTNAFSSDSKNMVRDEIRDEIRGTDSSSAIKSLLRLFVDKALDGRELESRKLVKQFIEHVRN